MLRQSGASMEDMGFDLSWDDGIIKIGLEGESYILFLKSWH